MLFRMGRLKGHKLPAFLRIEGHGLLAEHVNAHLHRRFRYRHVKVMGQADVHHVGLYLFDHGFIIGIEGNSLRRGLLSAFIDITDRRQRNIRIALNRIDMNGRNISQADDSRSFHS